MYYYEKILSGVLAAALLFTSFSFVPSIVKADAVVSNVTETQSNIETRGAKTFFAKIAVDIIKISIDKGGDGLSTILKFLDKDTAKYFKNNKNKVVKSLDKLNVWLDNVTDYSEAVIRNRLYNDLRSFGVPSKYALSIADAIAATISTIIF